jgi:hypothetical protein
MIFKLSGWVGWATESHSAVMMTVVIIIIIIIIIIIEVVRVRIIAIRGGRVRSVKPSVEIFVAEYVTVDEARLKRLVSGSVVD